MPDSLSSRYAELLTGSYDCVDRIVLNAFFRMGHGPGGFPVWWRALTGSEETLDNAHLMRLAGRFSPCLGAGTSGSKRLHSASVRSLSYDRRHSILTA
jgi:hypothetical protein